jgi:hypothetical protein
MKKRIYTVLLLFGVAAAAFLFLTWSNRPTRPLAAPPNAMPVPATEHKSAAPQSLVSDVRVTLPTPRPAMTTEIRQLEERGRREASLAVVADIYGPFLRQAGLGQDAADAFLNFTCDERLAALAAALAARAKGIRWMDFPETEEQVLRGATSRDADLRQLLGDQEYREFEEFRATSNIRTTINQINDRLDAANALTNDQVLQLARSFLALQKPQKVARAPADAVLQLIGMPLADPMVEAARNVLMDPQFAALEAVRESQLQAVLNPEKKTVGSPGVVNPGTGTH